MVKNSKVVRNAINSALYGKDLTDCEVVVPSPNMVYNRKEDGQTRVVGQIIIIVNYEENVE